MRIRLLAPLAVILTLCAFLAPARAQTAGWTTALTLPGGSINAIAFASDTNAWAAGAGGIYRSTDAGRTWSVVYTTHQFLDSIASAPDGRHGWAVGSAGAILVTSDGGATWHEQASNTNINLGDVAVLDARHAIAVGTGVGFSDVVVEPQPSIMLETKDAGATWSEVRLSGNYELHSVDFLADAEHGWMTATECVPSGGAAVGPGNCGTAQAALLATSDGGASWAPIHTDASLYRLQFVDEKTGWATGSVCARGSSCINGILRTTDGGATWSLAHDGSAAVSAFGASSAVAASQQCDAGGCRTKVERTTDAGSTWQTLATLDANFSSIALGEHGAGILAGYGPAQPMYTTDGGTTWQRATFPAVSGSGALSFPDATHGWFAASKLLRTTDGGATWTPVSDTAFDDIDFISATEGWGTTLRCSGQCHIEVLHTTDGGATWQQQYAADVPNPGQLTFVSPRDGWLVFQYEGHALHTTDGGSTWHDQSLPQGAGTSGQPASAAFVSATAGWAATASCEPAFANCHGDVYRTLDGGNSWAAVTQIPGDACSVAVVALDADAAWVTSHDCKSNDTMLFRTSDGGAHWTSSILAAPVGFGSLHFFDATTGRTFVQLCDAGGCTTAIARSSDGGVTWSLGERTEGYPGRAAFVAPEDIWMSANFAGGFTVVFAQTLSHYQGAEPPASATPAAKITLPDTGASTAGRTLSLEVLALLALGALSLAGATLARRR